MVTIKKFCIFCGKNPESKSKEHVIPKWLIQLTGNPKRKAFFGFDVTGDQGKTRLFSFDSFTFPACQECNKDFGKLESKTKPIVEKLLKNEKVHAAEITIFFDWLDKVRIGLWLGFHYLDKNAAEISPKFHIKNRVGMRDRCIIVYNTNYLSKGINFTGTEGMSFQYCPSSFSLRINNLIFFNVSSLNLCDRRLGFPFSKKTILVNKKQSQIDIVDGLQRTFFPVIRRSFIPKGIQLYQPIFREQLQHEKLKEFYQNDYVENNSLNFKEGIGNIYIEKNGRASSISSGKAVNIIPKYRHDYLPFMPLISKMSFDYQVDLFKEGTLNELPDEDKKELKRTIKLMKYSNTLFLKIIRGQAKENAT